MENYTPLQQDEVILMFIAIGIVAVIGIYLGMVIEEKLKKLFKQKDKK